MDLIRAQVSTKNPILTSLKFRKHCMKIQQFFHIHGRNAGEWNDWQTTILPAIKLILDKNVHVWIYRNSVKFRNETMHMPVWEGMKLDQSGLKEADKIESLPGQPEGVDFDQYSGYVTVDSIAGRALFYYFTEAPEDAVHKPLVLWLNGGPGCSSFGDGAMMELGPFRVNSDGTSLSRNDFAWNKVANVLFLESPAGVGFSYSNTTSDYDISGDTRTAQDSYTFLINWLERFPEYKTREFYIAGESYAGHYVPQLAYTILVNNKNFNQTVIHLKGIALGNAWVDDEETTRGKFDYWWMHNLIPDEIHDGITSNCNFSLDIDDRSSLCNEFIDRAGLAKGNIFIYNIYAPFCGSPSNSTPTDGFDPCSKEYIISYLNLPQVQEALHANTTFLPYPWDTCSSSVLGDWKEWQTTILPTIKLILDNNIRVWIYSGDIDGIVPVTSSTYSIKKLNLSPNTSWYSWFVDGEIGGYTVGYQEGLVFATVRGAGHFVPSYQPDRALKLFESFIEGEPLPPS